MKHRVHEQKGRSCKLIFLQKGYKDLYTFKLLLVYKPGALIG